MTGNIIGEPFEDFVSEQIDIRQSSQFAGYGNTLRTPEQLQYLNNRNAWVKLASSVKIASSDAGRRKLTSIKIQNPDSYLGTKLAESAILFNTLSSYTNTKSPLNSQRGGIAKTTDLWNDDFTYGIGGTDQGIQPPPGIIGVTVNSLNRGSIRKANVTLKAHNRFQFNLIELLYLRLGYTMMLEWGWDKYLGFLNDKSNDIVLKDVTNTIIENLWFESNGISQIGMINEINNYRDEYSGNYDGFFGKVSNFTWNFNTDGSYDISIDLITIGDVIESLKVNTSSKTLPVPPAPSGSAASTVESNNITKASYLNTIGYFLYQKAIELSRLTTDNNLEFRNDPKVFAQTALGGLTGTDGVPNYFTIFPSKKVGVGERTTAKSTQSIQIYIRLKEFLTQLETLIIPQISTSPGSSGNTSPQLQFEKENCYISHFPNQISLDPKVCVFKFPLHYGDIPTTTYGDLEGVFNPALDGDQNYLKSLADYIITKGDYTYGDLMNIYINFDFISKLLLSNGGPDQQLSLFKFLQDLCNGINDALGGVNKLEPVIKNDYIVTIIDQTYSQASRKDEVELEIYGYNPDRQTSNFVKDIKFVSKITPQLASMITIGATAAGSSTAEVDGTAFSKWSEGLIDRFSQEMLEPNGLDSLEKQQAQQKQQQTEEDYRSIWLGFPTSGNVVQKRINNAISAAARSVASFISGIGKSASANSVNITKIEAELRAKNQKLTETETRKIGSKYPTMLNEALTFNQFYPRALAFDTNLANNKVYSAEEIQDKVSINYLLYLINAFGGNTKEYKIPYPSNINKLKISLASYYRVTAENARYLEFNDSFISQGKSAYQNYLNNLNAERFKTINTPSSEVGFIPLSFELVLDGISGIKIYNKLNINNTFLPANYPESLKFIITKVDHSISNNSWDTSLSTISIPETDPYKFEGVFTSPPPTGNNNGTVPINSAGQNRDEYLASIQPINISRFLVDGDWIAFAVNYMVVKEGFTEFATPDYGHYRLGYGTRSLLLSVGANGKPNTRPAIKGDKTTQKDALIVLKYEIPITYKKAVVGNNSYKISEEDWNALNKYQRTALISYAYNCGSLNANIANAIKAKDYVKAANLIQNGPVTGKGKPLELLNGLVRRRAEEAALFRYKP
jgi:GH24 family phage-related lysozyme (muramidase)